MLLAPQDSSHDGILCDFVFGDVDAKSGYFATELHVTVAHYKLARFRVVCEARASFGRSVRLTVKPQTIAHVGWMDDGER